MRPPRCWSRCPKHRASAGRRCTRPAKHDGLHRIPAGVWQGEWTGAAEWESKPHVLTDEERRRAQVKRAKTLPAASRRGWETRRARGGFGLTHAEQVDGAKASGAIAKEKGHEHFVELGRKSGQARRERAARPEKGPTR